MKVTELPPDLQAELKRLKDEKQSGYDEYNEFMNQYDIDHALCPKCKSKGHSSTLVGYILDMANKDDYKDLNRCSCGDTHTTHDRVKSES